MKIAVITLSVFAALIAVCTAMVIAVGMWVDDSPADATQDVINTCQNSAKKALKDPDSARFDDWTAWETTQVGHFPDEKDYSAKGMVNAKNGFGGYTGDEPYACDAQVHSGTVSANAHPA